MDGPALVANPLPGSSALPRPNLQLLQKAQRPVERGAGCYRQRQSVVMTRSDGRRDLGNAALKSFSLRCPRATSTTLV